MLRFLTGRACPKKGTQDPLYSSYNHKHLIRRDWKLLALWLTSSYPDVQNIVTFYPSGERGRGNRVGSCYVLTRGSVPLPYKLS